MGELSFELNGDNGKELMVSYSDEGYGYGPPIVEDDDYVQHLSRIVDFRKIQPVKFDDPEIERIQFSSWKAFFSFDDVEEARFEGDYSVAYLLYKYHKKYKEIPKLLRFGNEVISGKFYDKFYHYMADHHAEAFDFSHTYDNKDMELQNFAVAMDRMLIYFDGHSSYLLYPDSYLENTHGNVTWEEGMDLAEVISVSDTQWSTLYNMLNKQVYITLYREYHDIRLATIE